MIEHTKLDAILLDLTLPDTDGLVLIPTLKKLSDTPILVLSARQSQLNRVLSLRMGADDFLSKPFDLDELDARLATILRRTMDPSPPALLDKYDPNLELKLFNRAMAQRRRAKVGCRSRSWDWTRHAR